MNVIPKLTMTEEKWRVISRRGFWPFFFRNTVLTGLLANLCGLVALNWIGTEIFEFGRGLSSHLMVYLKWLPLSLLAAAAMTPFSWLEHQAKHGSKSGMP